MVNSQVELSTLRFNQAPFAPKQVGQSLDKKTLALALRIQLIP